MTPEERASWRLPREYCQEPVGLPPVVGWPDDPAQQVCLEQRFAVRCVPMDWQGPVPPGGAAATELRVVAVRQEPTNPTGVILFLARFPTLPPADGPAPDDREGG